jgi:hypothetical protein
LEIYPSQSSPTDSAEEPQNENIKGLYPPLYHIIKDYFKIVDLFEPVTNEEKVYTQEAVNNYMVYFFALEKKIMPELSSNSNQSSEEGLLAFIKEERFFGLMEIMFDLRDDMQKTICQIASIMCMIDPARKKHPHASLAVAGKLSGHPHYRSKEFNAALGFTIQSEILLGKSNIARDIADLSNQPLKHNRSSACLAAFARFKELMGRSPTKKELETEAVENFPEHFANMDAKEWRRLRKLLGFHEWLEDGKRGIKKGGKKK